MKNDRFLIGILIFIGVVVVAALVLFFAGGAGQEYRSGDSPEDVVFNYTLAVTNGDFQRAYGYLAEWKDKPSETVFRSHFLQFDPLQNAGLRVENSEILDGEAVVRVTIVYSSSGPFDSGYSSGDSAVLELQDGAWKIKQMPYPYWDFGWFEGLIRP